MEELLVLEENYSMDLQEFLQSLLKVLNEKVLKDSLKVLEKVFLEELLVHLQQY
jgi:hypothetical protein